MQVIDRRGSYRQSSAQDAKKAEGKKRKSPCTPYGEKEKGKETQTGFPKETVFRAGARAREAAAEQAYTCASCGRFCRNRRCHPVRHWAIFDLAKHEKLSRESAERLYYRHLARLHAVFGVSQVG